MMELKEDALYRVRPEHPAGHHGSSRQAKGAAAVGVAERMVDAGMYKAGVYEVEGVWEATKSVVVAWSTEAKEEYIAKGGRLRPKDRVCTVCEVCWTERVWLSVETLAQGGTVIGRKCAYEGSALPPMDRGMDRGVVPPRDSREKLQEVMEETQSWVDQWQADKEERERMVEERAKGDGMLASGVELGLVAAFEWGVGPGVRVMIVPAGMQRLVVEVEATLRAEEVELIKWTDPAGRVWRIGTDRGRTVLVVGEPAVEG